MSEYDRMATTIAGQENKVSRRFDGIIGLNEAGRMVFVNSETSQLLGCTPEDLIDVFEAIQPLSTTPGSSSMDTGYLGGLAEKFLDSLLIRHDGHCFRIEYEIVPIVDKPASTSTLVFLRDASAATIACESIQ